MFIKALNELCGALAVATAVSFALGALLWITVSREAACFIGPIVFVISLPGALFMLETSDRRTS